MAALQSEAGIVDRGRLFTGICLALIPTGMSFALVSNVIGQLKQEFILTNYQVGLIGGAALWGMAIPLLVFGPFLETYGLRNAARMAFAAHVIGLVLMISAATRVGDSSAFWILFVGAATLAIGNGMIEVTGNPLVAALYPQDKTTKLNLFHAFFPLGGVIGGLIGFGMANWGGALAYWPFQIGVVLIPILIYGGLVLPLKFPKTENAEAGMPIGEMFRYTFTSPLFLLMLVLMAITTSMELGPMRWIPPILEGVGIHGILVLVWINGWMVLLRFLAHHFVDRFSPSGMLLGSAVLTGSGLYMLSFVSGLWSALAVATLFAWGVAFFFPTMVGSMSERLPRTGSLGIVLMAGVGLGTAGAVGIPVMGSVADQLLADRLQPAETMALLEDVQATYPQYLATAQTTTDPAALGYVEADVAVAIEATNAALAASAVQGEMAGDLTANALRAISASQIPGEPTVGQAAAILGPAEAEGGQESFRSIAPVALILVVVFGIMYVQDRRRGGYRVQRLDHVDQSSSI